MQSGQHLPVSAIANFRPVLVSDLTPTELTKSLKSHPYQRFPALHGGALAGIYQERSRERDCGKASAEIGKRPSPACPARPFASLNLCSLSPPH